MLKRSKYIRVNSDRFNYYVYFPSVVQENMPVLVYLHGIGERGNELSNIEKYALPKYMNKFEIPYIVIAPQCYNNNFWDYHLRDVEKVIEKEYKIFQFDKKNIFILGSSMGAYGAWNYLIQRPLLFKGIVSVSGGIMLPIEQNLELIKDKSILIYHGDNDNIVDVSESLEAYNKLKKIGATNLELKIMKGENHYLTSHAFKDEYLYKWLEKNIKGVSK